MLRGCYRGVSKHIADMPDGSTHLEHMRRQRMADCLIQFDPRPALPPPHVRNAVRAKTTAIRLGEEKLMRHLASGVILHYREWYVGKINCPHLLLFRALVQFA